MALTNNQINELIAYNLPNNNQQLISPAKVREVLLAMQAFSDDNIYVPNETLQSVTDRGAATNKTLTVAGMSIGNSGFFATVGAATLAANRSILLPNENGTLLTNNSALDATKVSGVLDPANIPLMYSGVQVVSSGGIADLTAPQQAQITRGAIVTTTDGRRWTYTGTGSKTSEASYILVADVTPEWSVIANKPSTFTPSAHVHDWADITTGKPTTAAGYGISDAVVTSGSYSNPSWLTGLAWSKLSGVPSTFTPSAHSHAWSDITSGVPTTLAGYGISDGVSTSSSYSNPTWLTTLAWSKITGVPATFPPSAHTHAWSDITSGLPTTLAGYGITNGVPTTRTITINGTTFDLSADRSWTVSGGGTPGGSTGQVQYNSSGSFAGSSTFTFSPALTVAASTTGAATSLTPALTAGGNSAIMIGLDIAPTFTAGGFTNLQNYTLRATGVVRFNRDATSTLGTNAQTSANLLIASNSFGGALAFSHYSNGGAEMQSYVNSGSNIGGFIAMQRQGGNVLVGTITDNSFKLQVQGDTQSSASANGALSVLQTWNTTGSPTAFLLNVTNTASGAAANLMDLQVGGTSQFKVSKAGAITTASPSGAQATWKLGRYITVSSVSLVSTRCVMVEIDGGVYYLGVVN